MIATMADRILPRNKNERPGQIIAMSTMLKGCLLAKVNYKGYAILPKTNELNTLFTH
jgi:hypothetical protein